MANTITRGVATARALVNRPTVVLGDEPAGSVGTRTSQELVGLMRWLNREERVTFVIVTHDLDMAGRAFDFDDPAVAGAERATLAAFLPQVGTNFIAASTLMNEWFHCGGAITVFRAGSSAQAASVATSDPWRTLGPHRLYPMRHSVFRASGRLPGPTRSAMAPQPLAGRRLCAMTSAEDALL